MQRIEELEKRVASLERQQGGGEARSGTIAGEAMRTASNTSASAAEQQPVQQQPIQQQPLQPAASDAAPDPLRGATFNLLLDTYYAYNFNAPIGRANLLRAYDVSSNNFSLNQAALVIENAPDAAKGKRFGVRLDLQYGQATQALQGNPVNEPRPDIYRAVFQAYGTYVFPVNNNGLTVDFGKWSSSLGIEGNYTKDQINYSRSYLFDVLPFYHMGLRANYKVNNVVGANFWLVNGTQQTEAFNNFKDQLYGVVLTPKKNVTWYVNYYLGQEHPDVIYYPNGGAPAGLPSIQGVPFQPIPNAPSGHLNIFDSYLTWQASPKLTFALEGDALSERLYSTSPAARDWGGAVYAQYRFTPRFAAGARAEYLSDRGKLFSGEDQALKETTLTIDYNVADGFLMRAEWRRDFSNHPFFYTSVLGNLKKEQNTATLGMVWWFGAKQGSW
jgi:hypothetical protein